MSGEKTDVHVEKFLGNEGSLVVQGVEMPPASPIVVMVGPILQRDKELQPGLPLRPVPHDVLPSLQSRCHLPIFTLHWEVWDHKPHRWTSWDPLGTYE